MTNYREFETTGTPTGGRDGGKVHRLYSVVPTLAEIRILRAGGWKKVDLTTGFYAATSLKAEALNVSDGSADGQVWTK